MAASAGADTADRVVDYFCRRFLRVSLAENDRAKLVDFLRGKLGGTAVPQDDTVEASLRELLYLILSAPEYQLG